MNSTPRDIPVTTEKSREQLTRTRLTSYRDHREEFVHWLQEMGLNPDEGKGYADETVRTTAANTDLFNRWVWDREARFIKFPQSHHANDYLEYIRDRDLSDTAKAAKLKALKRYFRWRGVDWEPAVSFSGDDGRGNPKDYFTREERKQVRDASHDLGSVPAYETLDRSERAEWKAVLANRLRVPKSQVGPEEFEQANGYKWPSIVNVSLDAGLRPIEVGRARVSWCDTANKRLVIPKEESSKGSENWIVGLRSETATILEHWLEERRRYSKYDDTDRLWLTRDRQPYSSRTLNYWLDKLIEETGIRPASRDLTWYSMRHSTGTYVTNDRDLSAAKSQLRHKRPQTTMRYDQTPADELSDALEEIED